MAGQAATEATFETIADGVHVLYGGGNPNVAAIEGEDFVVCFDARSTPAMARAWLDLVRQRTDKPVRYLVLSHYHAVRVLGASAFPTDCVIAHTLTHRLIEERGQEDWDTELARFPHAFGGHEEIPGLTIPTVTFEDRMTIGLGRGRTFELAWNGRGHTSGDIVGWLPHERIMFAADLVEKGTIPYTGEAYHREWTGPTLERLAAYGAEQIVAGRGGITRTAQESTDALEVTRAFLQMLWDTTTRVHRDGGEVRDAYKAVVHTIRTDHAHLEVAQQDVVAFSTYRCWQEVTGTDKPLIWTPNEDQRVLRELQG